MYVYKLQVELFQYASERIDTGIKEVDDFETLKSFDVDINPIIDVPDSFGDNNTFKEQAADILFNTNNPFGEVDTFSNRLFASADSTKITADTDQLTTDRVN